jgi:hypothetical protein
MELALELTAEGRYTEPLVPMEVGAAFNNDPGAAELAILGTLAWECGCLAAERITTSRLAERRGWTKDIYSAEDLGASVSTSTGFVRRRNRRDRKKRCAHLCPSQFRSGYPNRPHGFPWSLALIGLPDLRDYKVASAEASDCTLSH